MGDLMARFNAVAAANPLSWFPTRRDAGEIMTVTPDNRMIYFPYPKYVNAVMDVDMGAAVIVTDAATARSWGLGADEVAYLAGWADAHDLWYLSQRPVLHRSPALAECARRALDSAGVTMDEVEGLDLYACFPSSVEVARDSFDIAADDPRPLTLTGGLPYHGGPGSNYVTHAVANTLQWLRDGYGEHALVHGNGYYLTKHAVGLYYPAPARRGTTGRPTSSRSTSTAWSTPWWWRRRSTTAPPATIVAYTVPFDREDGPQAADRSRRRRRPAHGGACRRRH